MKWRRHDDAQAVELERRQQWADELAAELPSHPCTGYTTSGDSIVIGTRDEYGHIDIYDCRIVRTARIED